MIRMRSRTVVSICNAGEREDEGRQWHPATAAAEAAAAEAAAAWMQQQYQKEEAGNC